MNSERLIARAALLVLLALLAACRDDAPEGSACCEAEESGDAVVTEEADPAAWAGTGTSQPVYFERALPDFNFTDQDGKPFGLKNLKGKVWVADFIFIRCSGPCPMLTSGFRDLQGEFKDLKEVELVTFSVDPAHDTPAELKAYAEKWNADTARWHFLQGTAESLKKLIAEGFLIGDPNDPINHSIRFCLVDQDGKARAVFDWRDEAGRTQLRGAIRKLVAGEAL